jgi:hypothetical protein
VTIGESPLLYVFAIPLFLYNGEAYIKLPNYSSSTYDHSQRHTQDPVRSPYDKTLSGGLVVKWVTIGESLLLYVFAIPLFL